MFYRIFDPFLISMFVWFLLFPLILLVSVTDKMDITIQNDYQEEYNQCQIDLKNTQPICPEVEVKSSGWVFPFLLGVVWGYMLYEFLSNKFKKKKKNDRKN